MRIIRGDASDRATTQACFEIVRAADAVDDPDGPPWSLKRLRGWIEHPTDPIEIWLAVDEIRAAPRQQPGARSAEEDDREKGEASELHVQVDGAHDVGRGQCRGTAVRRCVG